jgi:activating signal cointegrator complex subunit 3
MISEPPRLSQALLSGTPSPLSQVDAMLISRSLFLNSIDQVSSNDSMKSSFTWENFAESYSRSHEKDVPRKTFFEVLNLVSSFFDGSDSENAEAAGIIYSIVASASGIDDLAKLKRDVDSALHVEIDVNVLTKLKKKIEELVMWKKKYLGSGSSSSLNGGLNMQSSRFHPKNSSDFFMNLSKLQISLLNDVLPPPIIPDQPSEKAEKEMETIRSSIRASMMTESSSPSRGKPPAAPIKIDEVWLYAQCAQFSMHHNTSFGSMMAEKQSPVDLGANILTVLHKHSSKIEHLQAELFDLLGDSAFEFMQALIEHAKALSSISVSHYKRVATTISNQIQQRVVGGDDSNADNRKASRPSIGPGVVVMTEAQKAELKAQQKDARKLGRHRAALATFEGRISEALGVDIDGNEYSNQADYIAALIALGFDPEYLERERKLGLMSDRKSNGGGGSNGFHGPGERLLSPQEAIDAIGAGMAGPQKKVLPLGTVEIVKEGYKEVSVPPSRPPPLETSPKLVEISSLVPIAQIVFKGIKTLNRLQSELFEAAYNSSENLLVCAPTGAGKTNVALLAVCNTVQRYLDSPMDVKVSNLDFKIVYVAPMKALAQEVVSKFSQRMSGIGLRVRELTGDMQLTRKEIEETQVIVTTPEKWDVITRKAGDGTLISQVRLLIIDEVHLLADERGAVIESIVARTLRLVETSQSFIRIVGLSATLPNYADVGAFLQVNPSTGLFYFNDSYRPVPLQQTFIGVTEKNALKRVNYMNKIAWDKAINAIRKGKQVMVFVHSRKDTAKTARALRDIAVQEKALNLLSPFGKPDEEEKLQGETNVTSSTPSFYSTDPASSDIKGEGKLSLNPHQLGMMLNEIEKSRNKELQELYKDGFGIHHAGMLRADRNLSERMFASGVTKILVCTATLAWGVNLPAHTVIIKGTQVYNAESGGFADLGMLDVMQIFGRAGRPQFDTTGEGIIITAHESLQGYLAMLTSSMPIESSFIKALPDHLNAEIVSGTVTNVKEAINWLKYTYLFIRMRRNPLVYGIGWDEVENDHMLQRHRLKLIEEAAKRLDTCHMIRFDSDSGNFAATDLGRVASHYYIHNNSIETFDEVIAKDKVLTDAEALDLICQADEFKAIKVRDEELSELDSLKMNCSFKLSGDVANSRSKVNVLLQNYISGSQVRGFTLISDIAYITQSAGRISRALFEIFLRKSKPSSACIMLTISKAIEKRLWWNISPLWQFSNLLLKPEIIKKIDDSGTSLNDLFDLTASDLGALIRHPKMGATIYSALAKLPYLDVTIKSIQPLTRSVLRISISILPSFEWQDRIHGAGEPYWVWIEDTENEYIYHHESFVITKKIFENGSFVSLEFTIPVFEPLPTQLCLKIISDKWLGIDMVIPISFQHLLLPQKQVEHTKLQMLTPLPITALKNKQYEAMYSKSFSHFNPIQTQIFHAIYHTDANILLGAPTGSGKTIAAELAIFHLFNTYPKQKVVYIAPLKALVSERLKDWKKKFEKSSIGRSVAELTGDVTPDIQVLKQSDIIITTPEKWDGITRNWKRRSYVGDVGLVIIDEIHLLGEDRGPVLEVIVSRMRLIASLSGKLIRFVGLSTALANAVDLGNWLGIREHEIGLYNFPPSVRPIPMEVHIQGFPGKHYCPRMATMNKPSYAAITTYSPTKPVLIFVSSRRQTRLTALDLISYCSGDDNPKRFLNLPPDVINNYIASVQDEALRSTLAFGIGIHHAGLSESDRNVVEELFCSCKIQVLVCTATLAWGVNFPAHLVIIKGTEYFDTKVGRYVDVPLTDVLQMMGRAGRPQFDTTGVAVLLVHEPKKQFYRRFLYEPFPVESQLIESLHNHLMAEICGNSISSRQDCVEYLTWTYFFRRLVQNPTYYGLSDVSDAAIQEFLYKIVDDTLLALVEARVVVRGEEALLFLLNEHGFTGRSYVFNSLEPQVADDGLVLPKVDDAVSPSKLGLIASYYYLDFKTIGLFETSLEMYQTLSQSEVEKALPSAISLLKVVCDAHEFDGLPVRHYEEQLNEVLAGEIDWDLLGEPNEFSASDYSNPHVKAFLLHVARFQRTKLPIADYINDTKSVLDQTIRVLNALIDVSCQKSYLETTVVLMQLMQAIVQAIVPNSHPLSQFPFSSSMVDRISKIDQVSHIGAKHEKLKSHVQNQKLDCFSPQNDFLLRLSKLPREQIQKLFMYEESNSKFTFQDFYKLLSELPKMELDLMVKSNEVSKASKGTAVEVDNNIIQVKVAIKNSNQKVSLSSRSSSAEKAYTPFYAKGKSYSWWMVLYLSDSEESIPRLAAVQRISSIAPGQEVFCSVEVNIESSVHPILSAALISDTIKGIDVIDAPQLKLRRKNLL